MGQSAGKLRNFVLALLSLLVPIAVVIAQEPTPLWTDTIRSSEGVFAVVIDPESKTASIIRSDDRAGPSPQLRVLILRDNLAVREIPLKFLERPGSTLRYLGEDPAWDGAMTGFRVELSFDGKSWKSLAPK